MYGIDYKTVVAQRALREQSGVNAGQGVFLSFRATQKAQQGLSLLEKLTKNPLLGGGHGMKPMLLHDPFRIHKAQMPLDRPDIHKTRINARGSLQGSFRHFL